MTRAWPAFELSNQVTAKGLKYNQILSNWEVKTVTASAYRSDRSTDVKFTVNMEAHCGNLISDRLLNRG